MQLRLAVLALLGASAHGLAPVLRPAVLQPFAGAAAIRRGGPIVMGGAKDGPFTPIVKLTKRIMGQDRFISFRGKVIAEHTKVIQGFVETADSPFGCLALKKLFEMADMDGNGTIDRDELKVALQKLGFSHLSDSQLDKILERADGDDNFVIDYDEFVAEAPKTLKVNLVKLAKNNGAELGFLS